MRRRRPRPFAVALLAALGLVGLAPGHVAAQGDPPGSEPGIEESDDRSAPAVTWGISPAGPAGRDVRSTIERVVEPGETVTERVVVDNFGEEPILLDLYAADARPAGGAFDVNAADEESVGVGAWSELSLDRLLIPARGEIFVDLEIRVPDDATPGDHAGGVLASRRTAGVGEEVGIETERRVGTRVYLRVAGPIRPELDVVALEGSYDHQISPIGRGDVALSFEVRNTGNVRLSGVTSISISGPFGLGRREVEGPVVEDLLPGHGVELVAEVDAALPLGWLDVEVEVQPTASIDQALGAAVAPGAAELRVSAVPFATLLALAAVLLVVALRRRRRRRRRTAARSPVDVPPEGSPQREGSEPSVSGAPGESARQK